MDVIHVPEDTPLSIRTSIPNSIFLAGPTPRDSRVESWRKESIEHLKQEGFDGILFVPETREWGWCGDYKQQVHWEWKALARAACTLFWVPRNLENMPGFTTNVEFGFMTALHPQRIVFGAPEDAPKTRYLKTMASEFAHFFRGIGYATRIPVYDTLRDTLCAAMKKASL